MMALYLGAVTGTNWRIFKETALVQMPTHTSPVKPWRSRVAKFFFRLLPQANYELYSYLMSNTVHDKSSTFFFMLPLWSSLRYVTSFSSLLEGWDLLFILSLKKKNLIFFRGLSQKLDYNRGGEGT